MHKKMSTALNHSTATKNTGVIVLPNISTYSTFFIFLLNNSLGLLSFTLIHLIHICRQPFKSFNENVMSVQCFHIQTFFNNHTLNLNAIIISAKGYLCKLLGDYL